MKHRTPIHGHPTLEYPTKLVDSDVILIHPQLSDRAKIGDESYGGLLCVNLDALKDDHIPNLRESCKY